MTDWIPVDSDIAPLRPLARRGEYPTREAALAVPGAWDAMPVSHYKLCWAPVRGGGHGMGNEWQVRPR